MVNDNDTDAVLLDYFSELLRSDESEHKSASTAGCLLYTSDAADE